MIDQRYSVILQTKRGVIREEGFDDKPSAELRLARLRAKFPAAKVSMRTNLYYVIAEYLRDSPFAHMKGDLKNVTRTIASFNDRESADQHAARMRKGGFGKVIVNVGFGPLYRVEWRDRITGKTGLAEAGTTRTRAENTAEYLNLECPDRDHWISVSEAE
jgi:hypothetical protein